LTTPVPAGEPIKIVFDKYEYANSPAAKLAGELVVVERLILIEVFAMIIVLFYCFVNNAYSLFIKMCHRQHLKFRLMYLQDLP
jgi:hypothetical protein